MISYRKVLILAICVFSAATMAVLGCNSSVQDTGTVQNTKTAEDYVLEGELHLEQQQFDEAIADFTKALELDPQNAATYGNLGTAYDCKGEYDMGMINHNMAIELDPEHAGVYYNRGVHYFLIKEYDEAIADLNMAIELSPEFALAYFSRGSAYYRKGDLTKAASDFEKVVQIATDPELAEKARQVLMLMGK